MVITVTKIQNIIRTSNVKQFLFMFLIWRLWEKFDKKMIITCPFLSIFELHTLVINIPRQAKWVVFVIELNLLLPCFGLQVLYWQTPDPGRRPGITPLPYTNQVLIWAQLVQLFQLFICGYTTDLAGEAFVFSPVTREFILKLFPVLCQWKTA